VFGGDAVGHKATAIINSEVVTQTDIDQRLACSRSPMAAKFQRRRSTVCASPAQPDRRDARDSGGQGGKDHDQADGYRQDACASRRTSSKPRAARSVPQTQNSSIKTLRRQIEGEIAWQRLQRQDRKRRQRRRGRSQSGVDRSLPRRHRGISIGEIFLPAPAGTEAQVMGDATKILEQPEERRFADMPSVFPVFTAAVGGTWGGCGPSNCRNGLPP
jgi:peptidyl-prolyl cis-trans isomerase SurA